MMEEQPKGIKKALMGIISTITPNCETITFKISESLDHPISPYERFQIGLHTMGCKFCARYRDQLIIVHNLLQTYSEEELKSEHLSEVAVALITRKMNEHLPK